MSWMTAATLPISHDLFIDMVSTEYTPWFCDHSPGLDGFFGVFLEVMVDRNDTLGREFLDFFLSIVFPRKTNLVVWKALVVGRWLYQFAT